MASSRIVNCACGCGQEGLLAAHGWIKPCYLRWLRNGRSADGPPPPAHAKPRANSDAFTWRQHLSRWDYAKTVLDRLLANVDALGDCWVWTRSRSEDGYGQISVKRAMIRCHQVSYALFVGEVPLGLELDHLCRVRACCNPWHLEPVTGVENTRRGLGPVTGGLRQKAKTHCPWGHPYDAINTYVHPVTGYRWCRACRARRMREAKAREKTREQEAAHELV